MGCFELFWNIDSASCAICLYGKKLCSRHTIPFAGRYVLMFSCAAAAASPLFYGVQYTDTQPTPRSPATSSAIS